MVCFLMNITVLTNNLKKINTSVKKQKLASIIVLKDLNWAWNAIPKLRCNTWTALYYEMSLRSCCSGTPVQPGPQAISASIYILHSKSYTKFKIIIWNVKVLRMKYDALCFDHYWAETTLGLYVLQDRHALRTSAKTWCIALLHYPHPQPQPSHQLSRELHI
jgi:hypothetical protein